jgi:DNA mismatch endonuclease (patch repair protein)
MDNHTQAQRAYNMSRVKNKNTSSEIIVRKWLWVNGYRYRLHYNLPGKPDIVFPCRRKAIFINGCFWHKHNCKYFSYPATNADFWINKINSNVLRDQDNHRKLRELGWEILVIWTCELKPKVINSLCLKIINFLDDAPFPRCPYGMPPLS